jgi:hypothetical protein
MESYLAIRKVFERYAKEGTRPYEYNLTRLAGGEYVSCTTERAWKIFRDAYLLAKHGEHHVETNLLTTAGRQTHISTKKSSRASKNQ